MGDHDTWYTLLSPEFWHALEHNAAEHLARDWKWMMFQATHFSLLHVAGAVITFVFLIIVALRYRQSIQDETKGIVPPKKFTLAAMVDAFVGTVYKFSADVMGEKNAKTYLPLTATLGLFIFVSNLQGLIPGFLPPTDSLKTNIGISLLVFVVYNTVGIYKNKMAYLAHFCGPKIGGFRAMFPLLLPIELVSHIARPVSLSLRLTGNILADHKVVALIALSVPLFVPLPFLLLGTVVAIVQTLIFTLLTIMYIGQAVEIHEEH